MAAKRVNWGTPPWKVAFRPKSRALPGTVDFAIVGGGFAGLSAAAWLACLAPGKSVLVLEADSIGSGASGRTGGMALAETAAGPLPGLGDVLAHYKKILRKLRVNAQLHLPGVFELARKHTRKDSPISWSDLGTLRVARSVPGGTVHPPKVVAGLARAAQRAGAQIVENVEVRSVRFSSPIQLHVRSGRKTKTVHAHHVLFATNAASLSLLGLQRVAGPRLTLAIATERLSKKQIQALGLSSRRPFYTVDYPYLWGKLTMQNQAIFGSGLIEPKKSKDLRTIDVRSTDAAERFDWLEQRVGALHPAMKNVRITHRWGGPILLTPSALPVFRRHPQSRNAIILAGFNGHGVALSVYLGQWAAQAFLGRKTLPKWTIKKK